MAMRYIVFFAFITILFLPLRVFALGFGCCQCEAKTINKNFCVLIPDTKGCVFASEEIDKNTGEKFEISCTSLAMESCKKLKTSASAQCANQPEAYDKINEAFLTNNSSNGNQVYATATKPVLGVDIPGVTFPDKLEIKDNMVQIPYLAIYIIGLHKYLIGIGLVTAAIIIIYGGILYIIASTGAKVSDAKDKIKDGVMGLAIILASTAILANINPNTTNTGAMKVAVVSAQDTPEDPAAARSMVEESAKIRWSYTMPGISEADFQDGPVSKVYIPPDGVIARNEDGLPIAQGECPPDMIAIRLSPAYKIKTKKEVSSFCIDRYEAPNRRGIKPYSGVLGIEAAWWCDQRAKRLCTVDEWQRACLGSEGKNTYGYGETYIAGEYINKGAAVVKTKNEPAPCNYDSVNPDAARLIGLRDKVLGAFNKYYPQVADGSILVPEQDNSALFNVDYREAYYAAKQYLEEINTSVEVSGRRPRCVTEEGVVDMPANVQEIALRKKMSLSQLTALSPVATNKEAYAWMGFYWSPIAHLANLQAKPTCNQVWGGDHSISWRGFETGFRCCMDLNDVAEKPAEEVVVDEGAVEDTVE
ncbi:MAG: hypothetical protein P1P90_06160 [Patescibacteria group bacterium]|nr:hypothetical protein [Patescibacteria group bacterium]